ncbi:MAG TPA: serine hydrolase domain-containing protein [Gemmatimonadaceae bacterium]
MTGDSVKSRSLVSLAMTASMAFLSPAILLAQNALPDSVGDKIDAVFAKYPTDGPGCAMGVFQDGKVAFAKGYGLANIEYGVSLTPKTPMIMGSVSKQFTAAAIALLVEQGRISLDDDVHKYIPELADYGKKITINHLVHHTSGVRDWWALVDAAGMRPDDGYTVADVLALAARQKGLNFEPGAEYNYSNTGYILMGIVVQRVTGKSLRQFAAEQIFGPLGMTTSHFHDDHNEPVNGRAFAYSPIAGKPGRWTINVWNNDLVGQGGLMTTVEDLQKWDENFYTGKVGGKGFLARQLEQGKLNDGKTISYAFGVQVGAYRGLPMVEHSGSTGGYRTDIARFPSAHTSVVTMCNVSTADAGAMALRVADAVLGNRFTQPVPASTRAAAAQQQATTIKLTDAQLNAFVGRYYSDELNATYELSRVGPALVLNRPRAETDTLRATDAETLRGRGLTIRVTGPWSFTVDNGRARGLVFNRVKG